MADVKFYCDFDGIFANFICNGIVVTNSATNLVTQVQSEVISGTSPSVNITDVSSICKK